MINLIIRTKEKYRKERILKFCGTVHFPYLNEPLRALVAAGGARHLPVEVVGPVDHVVLHAQHAAVPFADNLVLVRLVPAGTDVLPVVHNVVPG